MCCLKRPFDDQRAERVRREALAVASLIERAQRGELELVRSPAHRLENEANPREDRRMAAAVWLDGASVEVPLSPEAEARARALVAQGFPTLDALHVALAEAAGARWLATCDDHLLPLARRHSTTLRVEVVDPCDIVAAGSGS
jgi:predicted nucleic acid-binding protein